MKGLKKRMLSLVTALAIGCGLLTPMGGAIPQAYAAQAEQTEQSGQYAGITWRYANHTLTLSGGPLPDAPQEGDTGFPWDAFAQKIDQVVLAEDVKVVSGAPFQCFSDGLCVIFQQDEIPTFTGDFSAETAYMERVYVPYSWVDMHEGWRDTFNCALVPYNKDRSGFCGLSEDDSKPYGENLRWTLDGDTLTISGEGEMANWDRGDQAPWAFYADEIRHVVIQDGVQNIGRCAFSMSSDAIPRSLIDTGGTPAPYALETVDLGSTVQTIGAYAFADCTTLQSIKIPDSIRTIDYNAFQNCTGLTELTFAPGAELSAMPYAFLGCTGLTQVEVPAAATGDEWADAWEHVFEGCTGLQAVIFRDGAARVGESMFEGCTNLSQVTLSDSVTAIDSWAFADCSDLAELSIPHAVTQVQEDAFLGCAALQTIHYDGYPDEWADVLVPSGEPDDGPLAGVTVICLEDTTPPAIENVTPGAVHNADFTVSATVSDNRPGIQVQIERCTNPSQPADAQSWTVLHETDIAGTSGRVSYSVPVEDLPDGVVAVRITATDAAGNPNTYTVEHIIDRTPPAVPTLTAVTPQSPTTLSITWSKPADADLASFRLYRKAPGENSFSLLASAIRQTGYTDTGLKSGSTYSYAVTAVDTAGNESAYSQEVSGTTPRDTTAPQILAVNPASGSTFGPQQTIKIYAGDDAALAGVTVEYRAAGSADTWCMLAQETVSGTSDSVTVTLGGAQLPDGAYDLRMFVRDEAGNQSAYTEVSYTLDATPPAVPAVQAGADGDTVTVTWSSQAEDDLAGFYIYRVTADGASTRIGSVSAVGGQQTYTFADALHWSLCGQPYTYRVTAIDRYGNTASASSAQVTPEAEADTQPPAAELTAPETAFAGDTISLSAAGSSDNRAIASYAWDFGDGQTATGKTVSHAYSHGGLYSVTLTVTDAAGNQTARTQEIAVTADEDNTQVTVMVTDADGTPIAGAQVVYDLGGRNVTYYADRTGKTVFRTTDSGTVRLGAYAADYLPAEQEVSLVHGQPAEAVICLEQAPLVTGTLESDELTYEEIRDLGIDTAAPENQNVYAFAAQINIGGNITEYTYFVNESGHFVGPSAPVQTVTVGDSVYTCTPHVVQVERPEEPGQPSHPEPVTIAYVTVLRVPGTVSVLKQFFEAELTVINQADAAFAFEGCTATLDIPDGLALVPTDGTAEAAAVPLTQAGQDSGVLRGGQSATAKWVLRGDTAGSYALTAAFDGTLRDFGVPIHADFAAEEPVEVRPASDLQLDLYVSNVMLDRTIYADLELSCDTGTVNLPHITLGDYTPQETVLRAADGTETPAAGATALQPGQTLVYRYVIQLGQDLPLLFESNLLEGMLTEQELDVQTHTRSITKFKLFAGDFGLTEMGVFLKTLPTLSPDDATAFWQFIYNTDSTPDAGNMYYRLLTGDLNEYDGTMEELRIWIASMFQAVRARMNCYVKESSETVGLLSDGLVDYLWGKLKANGLTGEDDLREYALKKILNGVRDTFLSIEDLPSSAVSSLQDITLSVKTLQSAKATMNRFISNMQAGLRAAGLVLESEYAARYAYFNYYLNHRIDYAHPGDAIFRLLLDSAALDLQNRYWTSEALDTITWITGTDSWVNHTDTIERWAETLYQFEVIALNYDTGEEPGGEEPGGEEPGGEEPGGEEPGGEEPGGEEPGGEEPGGEEPGGEEPDDEEPDEG